MTALHQAAQKAVEALKETQRVDEIGREPETHWESLRYLRRNVIAMQGAALESLRAALQQQPEPVALERWGRAKSNGAVSLERMPDGYWTPWHIAQEAIAAPPALQEVPREPVADADAAWVQRLRETAKHLRENSLSLAKYPGMSDEARARELAALYIGEIAELFEAKRAAASPSTTQQQPSVAAHALNTAGVVDHATQQQEVGNGDEWKQEAATVLARFIHLSAQPVVEEWAQTASAAIRLLNDPAGLAAAPSTPAREEAGLPAAGPARLWAMHIAGPDDVHAAPGEAEARAAAERFNAWFAQRKDPHPLDPQMHATAIEWPHSAEAHANDLPRWRDFVPPAAGVEGKCECGLSEVACRDPLRRSCPDGLPAVDSQTNPPADGGGE